MSNQHSSSGEKPDRLQFYGEEFVFDKVTGMFFRLNPSGSFMLRALAAGAAPADLPQQLQQRYGLDRATATRDAQLFLNSLAALEPLDRLSHPLRVAS